MGFSIIPRSILRGEGRARRDERRQRAASRRRVLAVDALEGRLVLSAMPHAAPVGPPPFVSPPGLAGNTHAAVATTASPNLLNFKVDSVSTVTDATGAITGLVANVSLGGQTQQVPLTITSGTPSGTATSAATTGATSSILSLHLAPINLDLLGLDVTTSDICLNVTATQGGGLLGDLLSGLNNALSGGGTLGSALGALGADLNTLTTDLTSLLNAALTDIISSATASFPTAGGTAGAAMPAATTPTGTPILDLSLGPVDLNLLGLGVTLDNCSGGPITVDITAIPSTQPGGGLLGDLLTNLDGLLSGGSGSALSGLERVIARDLRALI